MTSSAALAELWRAAGMDEAALAHASLPGAPAVLTSSFAVGTAAQASIAAAALAAAELWYLRTGSRQSVAVPLQAAALECTGYFTLDGDAPMAWEKYSGIYPCGGQVGAPGWVRVHGNFEHHRDAALTVLGLPTGEVADKADVAAALAGWRSEDFEQAVAEAGGVAAALRSFAAWDAHPQGRAVATLPPLTIERIGDGEPDTSRWREPGERPLAGLRVLDLTRILAGPVCGRTLAAYGAEVLLTNAPQLPNIAAIADTSRGKRSAHVDLVAANGRAQLTELIRGADVVVQGYRPGALGTKGFTAADVAAIRPGSVCVSLSAYGHGGPWAERRGFDSIVQTAAGFNHAEAEAFGADRPRPLPVQILDYASGFLMAFGAQVALHRQAREGGSWHVRVALAATGRWLRGLGRSGAVEAPRLPIEQHLEDYPCGFGALRGLPHAAQFAVTPARWDCPSMPPGTHPPRWSR